MRHANRTRRLGVLVAGILLAGLVPTSESLDGRWRSEGYGLYFEIEGSTLKAYELTSISCLPAFTAERTGDDVEGTTFKVVNQAATYLVRANGSASRRLIHRNGAASDVVVRRSSARPNPCARPIADTPLGNFDVFARTWTEQYGFFELRKADWPDITGRARARVTDQTTPHELFQILRSMIEPLTDAHTRIRAEAIGESWSGTRKSANWLEPAERARAFEIVEQKYLRGPLRSFCNGQVQYGRLDSGVGYLRLKSFSNFGSDSGHESGSAALESALDSIFADAPSWRGLVIDVRINSGGSDAWGLTIASRLATTSYVAYAKQARANPDDQTKWTAPQPSEVRPSARASYHGPVVELIGIHSVSAAETFTQALLGRTPRVTRIGENTQGVFSDVLTRHLPNGWIFGLPNERFVTDGKAYDVTGIAPDISVPVFPRTDLESRRDGALEKALDLVGGRRGSDSSAPGTDADGGSRYMTKLRPLLENIIRAQQLPGLAIGIVEGGRVAYAEGFGLRNLDRPDQPITTRSLFHMCSVTKPFVATSIMQLSEAGKVDLDRPVVAYLPYFRLADDRDKTITVRQMLTHTSGMPDVDDYEWDRPQFDSGALERYVRGLSNRKLEFAPGHRYQYSNMAFEVLGDLVAKVSGESFEDYVTAHILKPLRMSDSTLLIREADADLLAWGHQRDRGGAPFPSKAYPYNRIHTPSSDLHSNVLDMARWAMVNLNRGELDGARILSTNAYEVMWRPAGDFPLTSTPATSNAFPGISWRIGMYRGHNLVWHNGSDTGFRTGLALLPDDKIAVVWMTNAQWLADGDQVTRAALDAALGLENGGERQASVK